MEEVRFGDIVGQSCWVWFQIMKVLRLDLKLTIFAWILAAIVVRRGCIL